MAAWIFPGLSLKPHSAAEAESLPRAPFSVGALACLMGLALTCFLFPSALTRGGAVANYWWTRDLYQFRFHADALALGGVAALYAAGFLLHLQAYAQPTPSVPNRRASYLLAAIGSASAALLSADLIATLFLLGLFLLAVWLPARTDAPREADRMLLATSCGGALLTAGVLLMWQDSGLTAQDQLPLSLVSSSPAVLRSLGLVSLLGFVPLLIAFPAYRWLPRLGKESVGAAMAAGVLLLIGGGFLALRLLAGAVSPALIPGFAGLGVLLGLFGLAWGVIGAWASRTVRGLATWLTIAQSGLLLLALGLSGQTAPVAPLFALRAAALQALVAPLALLAVWSVAGVLETRVGTDAFPGHGGLLRPLPGAALALLLGGLSLSGVPPLPGYWGQRLMLTGQPLPLTGVVVLLDLVVLWVVLSAVGRVFLGAGTGAPLLPARRWLGAQLLFASLLLLVLSYGFTGLLQNWSEVVVRGLLAISP